VSGEEEAAAVASNEEPVVEVAWEWEILWEFDWVWASVGE
jgi:hypothetical protein